jgi:1L-myo-inositol 1-phosphate cytidylyltransferase / CDP-L-myo-inositol myo-inositolphosphotransferase
MADVGLIIAAGAGTRLADHTKIPKPLRKVCGIPLLQRIILCSAKAGLKKIVVVVGFQKEQLIDFINKKKWPVEVQVVENPHWKKSNGLSVLCAKQVIDEDFILLMSDHIFDPETLANLREEKLDGLQVKLAVDYKVHQIFDKDDATKVEVQNGKIKAIAKNLVQFNAIDTGMFLLSPKIFTAFEEVKKGDDLSISDGILHLASQGLAGVFNIGNGYWQDVDTKPCLKHAEKVLMNACRKPTDGIISRNFNRHVSIFISSFLIKTPITANQVTALVLLLGLFTGYMASLGGYVNFLVAGILFKLTSILDGVDGELAKLRFTASKFGQWFDTIGDNLTYIAFVVGTAVGLYRVGYEYVDYIAPSAIVGIVMLLICMFYYIIKFTDSGSLLAVQDDFTGQKDQAWWSGLIVKLHFLIKRDFFSVIFLAFAIAGKPQWILAVVAFATNIAWIFLFSKILRKQLQRA